MKKYELKLLLKEIISILREGMFPKEFDRHRLGSCMSAAALATDYFLSKGITNFKIVEGWVSLYPSQEEEDFSAHTWIEFSNGRKFDPTKKQWKQWGFNPDEVEYIKKLKEYTPQEYQNICKRQPNTTNEIRLEPPVDVTVRENMTYDELLKLTDKTPKSPEDGTSRMDRSKNVRSRSIPVSVEENMEQWNFRYKSNPSVTKKPFEGTITFLKGEVDKGDDAMELECKVDCGCPDYMYKFAYNNTKQGAGQIGPDSLNKCINRSPQPAYNIGEGLCKHLVALRGYLQTKIASTQKSNLFEAINEVAKQGPFNITYYD